MNIEFRIILLIIGLVIIAYVFYDGYKRLGEKKNAKLSAHDPDVNDQEPLANESLGIGKVRKSFGRQEPKVWLDDGDEVIDEINDFILDSQAKDDMAVEQIESITAAQVAPELIITVNLVAKEGGIQGYRLLEVLIEQGIRFGEMDMFHRYEKQSGKGQRLFTIANIFNPGVFNLEQMDSLETQGLSFFMMLPGPKKPGEVLDLMLKTAAEVAEALDCRILDGNRSTLTKQTILHYRDQIAEFERKSLTKEKQLVTH